MLGSGPGKLGLIAHDRFGDAVCLVVEDEREQVVASLAAAVAALVDEDAEFLGQWGLLMEWIRRYEQDIKIESPCCMHIRGLGRQ